jgi:hypothetical protein
MKVLMNVRILLVAITVLCFAACNGDHTAKSRGPIVLGDSAAIVTETDAQALHDQVPDLQPVIATNDVAGNTITVPPDDTSKSLAAPVPSAASGGGLTVTFKEVTLSIPGITTRSYGKPDLQKARGASYELTGGNLAGAQLRVSGGTVTKVSQQYETMIVLQDGSDKLPLESLGKYTSGWQPLPGAGGAYTIAGLEPSKLGYKQAAPSAIRNAVQQAARKQRLNRKDTQDWLDAARSIRAANQAPAAVVLRSVSWRVEGKGFSKELRVDVPVQ